MRVSGVFYLFWVNFGSINMATIIKRGDFWHARIRRKGFPPLSASFESKTDADQWARIQESEMDRGVWRNRSTADATTLFALIGQYLSEVVPGKKGEESESYRLRAIQRDKLALHKLTALTPALLATWRDARLATGLAGATVNRELSTISAMINWARKDLGMQLENPVSGIRRPKNARGRDRRFEGDEQTRLLIALSDHSSHVTRSDGKRYRQGSRNIWVKPVVELAIETAARRGELLSLRWENIDLKRRTAHLPETKNGDARTVPLSSRAVAILEALPRSIEGKVFPLTINALKLAFVRACVTAGLEDFHFHDLRHEGTSRLAGKLSNVLELSAVTGHKELKMLKRYYHPRAEDLALKLG